VVSLKCLDTNIIIDFLRGRIEALKKMKELENEPLSTTTINIFELLYGAKISVRKEDNVKEVKRFLSNLEIFSFDEKSAEECSNILEYLKKSGKMVGIRDLFIGGICISNNLELITNNIKHFTNIKKLKVEGY